MAHPVITFPQPPPTSNTLTPQQRQQLLKSTRKLTQLLGSAPHLTDCDSPLPVYLDFSSQLQSISTTPSIPRSSYDVPRPPSPASSISSVSTTASRTPSRMRFSLHSENHVLQDSPDPPFVRKRPPTLRLASPDVEFTHSVWSKTKLDTVPGSPPIVPDDYSSQPSPAPDPSDGDSTDCLLTPISAQTSPIMPSVSRSYTLPVPRRATISSPFIETSEPAFKVTSEAATRRMKMDRIRKRLGECVPVDAVFRDEDEDGDYVEVIKEKKPAQVNVDVRPRWKSSAAVVAFDVVYECPDVHGDEGLASGLRPAPRTPKSPSPTALRGSNTASPGRWGKLIKRTRKESHF